jgi:hypothetical protein
MAPTLTASGLAGPVLLIDLDGYPFLDLTEPAARKLSCYCREQLDRTGAPSRRAARTR